MILRQSVALFACYSLAFAPLLNAAQLSLPSGDLVAPKITQEKYIDTVQKNQSHKITVTVKDNVGVKQVIVFFRVIGTEAYTSQTMQNIKGTDNYLATIKPSQIKPPGIEYYVQAMDHAGNTLLHGYSFSPLSVKTVAGGSTDVASTNQSAKSDDDEEGFFSNKWVWIGLGVIVLGAAASGGGSSGGGGEPTATLTVNTAEPVN